MVHRRVYLGVQCNTLSKVGKPMSIEKSEGTTEYILDIFNGTLSESYQSLEEVRQAYEDGLKVREPQTMEMYRLHTLTYKEKISP